MDALGHVNNVAFNRYFETARAEYFVTGLRHQPTQRKSETGPVVTRVIMEYHRQVFFPAELEATVGVLSASSRAFELGCTLWSTGQLVARGESRHVWVDFATGRPARVPPEFRALLEEEKMADTDPSLPVRVHGRIQSAPSGGTSA